MLVFLSHRRLKAGSYDRYREAWEFDVVPEHIVREEIYHARSLENPDEVISFGIIDISRDEIPKMREAFGGEDAEARRPGADGGVRRVDRRRRHLRGRRGASDR